MQSSTIVERKPFHEAVVEMIQLSSTAELEAIGSLLMRCVIPKDHDRIAEAWIKRCTEMCWNPTNIAFVADGILDHKADLEGQKSKNPLDRFQFVDEKHA